MTEQNKEIKTLLPGELFGELACLHIKKADSSPALSRAPAHVRAAGDVPLL